MGLDLFFGGFGNGIYNAFTKEQYSNMAFVTEGRNVLEISSNRTKGQQGKLVQAPSDRLVGKWWLFPFAQLFYSFYYW